MIRIIDEEGFKIRVIVNNLNFKMKRYHFMVIPLDSVVRVIPVNLVYIECRAGNSLFIDEVYEPRNFDLVEKFIDSPSLFSENEDYLIEIDFESSSLGAECRKPSEYESCDYYSKPLEIVKNFAYFEMTYEEFEKEFKNDSSAKIEKIDSKGYKYTVVRYIDGLDIEEILKWLKEDKHYDLKTSSN